MAIGDDGGSIRRRSSVAMAEMDHQDDHHRDVADRTRIRQAKEPPRIAVAGGQPSLRHSGILLFPILIFAATITAFLVVLGAQSSSIINRLSFKAPWRGEHGSFQPLSMELHPERHVFRDPETIIFRWNISSGIRSPDGVRKQVYLVNDEFLGPTIEARSGDRIVIHVNNHLKNEGISLHWHGLRLQGFNDMDGAVGYSQCPIPPGANFTYKFDIGEREHGTFWWHAHAQLQRGDGLFGGLVVHRPRSRRPRDVPSTPEALLLVGDWFHRTQADVMAWYADARSFGNEPVPDSLLINGRGRYNCSMAVPARPVQCHDVELSSLATLSQPPHAQRLRLRLVNVGTIAGFNISVEGASLQAMETDGGSRLFADPADVVGIVYPGERLDVLVSWKDDFRKNSWLNIFLDDENFKYPNPALSPNQSFPISTPIDPHDLSEYSSPGSQTHNVDTTPPVRYLDLARVTSLDTIATALPPVAQETIILYIKTQKLARFANKPLGFINHTTWEPQTPPLLSLPRVSWDEHQLVPFIPRSKPDAPIRVDLILNNLDDGAHPFHLHGNSFYILSSFRAAGHESWGSYNPYVTQQQTNGGPPAGVNLYNPVKKDTVSVPRRGHVILTFMADNPGLWMLHCHMLVHLGTGMAAGIHVGDLTDIDHALVSDQSAARLCATAE